MRDHAPRRVGQRAERRKIGAVEFVERHVDGGSLLVAVDQRAPVSGNMFDHRRHARHAHAVDEGASQRNHLRRVRTESAFADDRIGTGNGQVEQRRAIDVDPVIAQQISDRIAVAARQLDRARRIARIEPAECGGGGESGPDRRVHALMRAALMIDQDRRVAAHRVAETGAQAA